MFSRRILGILKRTSCHQVNIFENNYSYDFYIGDFLILDDFKEYLREKKVKDDAIKQAINLINDFSVHLKEFNRTLDNATYNDLHSFSAKLIEENKNSFDNYIHLLRFGYFTNNNQLIIASMEIIDGAEVIQNFYERLASEFGEEIRNRVFQELKVPPLGLNPTKRPKITEQLIDNLIEIVGKDKCEKFLADGLRDKYTEYYKKDREMYLRSSDIDDFLEKKHADFITTLRKHQEDNSLFFTQEIDDSVIEYVEKNKCGLAGIRDGNRVLLTKIPYMTKQFLEEKDPQKKKYFYCHCPWVREGLLEEDVPVNPIFCNCSGGYFKNHWETILDDEVKVELLESILLGDDKCKFALHLPDNVV